MRADRLISLIIHLQNHNGIPARQLAEALEVSERTIYRDLAALSAAGIPVYTQSGPGGGCFLLEAYRTNLTGMTRDQLRALFTLGVPAPLEDLGMGQDLKAAFLRLSAALPAAQRVDEEALRQRVALDWSSTGARPERFPHLKTIHQAVWADRRLWLRYRALHAPWIPPLEGCFAPYGLVAWEDDWYLAGEQAGCIHVILVRNVKACELLADGFSRESGFDLAEFWRRWRQEYLAHRPVFLAQVRAAPQLAGQLQLEDAAPPDEYGWTRGTLRFETFEHARDRLLACGGAVEVLEPQALRCSVQDFAEQTRRVYAAG